MVECEKRIALIIIRLEVDDDLKRTVFTVDYKNYCQKSLLLFTNLTKC